MAMCGMDALVSGVGRVCLKKEGFDGAKGWAVNVRRLEAQRVSLSAEAQPRWASGVAGGAAARVSTGGVVASRTSVKLRGRCNAAPEGNDGNSKTYDVNEVLEKVVESEKDKLPESAKETPEPLPEGEPSPFSPAIDVDTDDSLHANQGERVSEHSLVEPPRGQGQSAEDVGTSKVQAIAGRTGSDHTSGAASSSLGETAGSGEQPRKSARVTEGEHTELHGDPAGSSKSGGRDWRVYSKANGGAIGERGEGVAVDVKVQKSEEASSQQEAGHLQAFGWSESACDEGSSFHALAGILQEDGGKSIDDYRTRANIFGRSAELVAAQKNGNHSVV